MIQTLKFTKKTHGGGRIISKKKYVDKNPIIGMSDVVDFTSFKITQYLRNRKISFIKNVLGIFKCLYIPVEHIPILIDSVSIPV